ncbi:MAG: acetoin utilization protein AcuC [Firmicutes bacterium]|nr:acetoin utilization protein AcuC [Bacillota bacterium]
MSGYVGFIYSPDFLKYRFSEDHPFNPLRLELTLDLLEEAGLLARGVDTGAGTRTGTGAGAGAGRTATAFLVAPRMATDGELLLTHDPAYIEMVKTVSAHGDMVPDARNFELGTDDNPVFEGMHEAASLVVGATLTAADLVMEGRAAHALNIAGGLHHAQRSHASGFCIYNDVAVAIAYLQRRYGARVAYIDTDAHHGDGVQWAFYDDPGVLTISFHETGRYLFPGTGEVTERGRNEGYGYSVNVPLEAFTEDDSFLSAFEAVVPPLVKAFAPDVIVSQNGCDGHFLDPLTHLSLTMRAYAEIPRIVHDLAHAVSGGRWIGVGGGGYDIWRVVPRAWAFLWAQMLEAELPEELPRGWLARWQKMSPVALPGYFLDSPATSPVIPRRAEITEKNNLSVAKVMAEALSIVERSPENCS